MKTYYLLYAKSQLSLSNAFMWDVRKISIGTEKPIISYFNCEELGTLQNWCAGFCDVPLSHKYQVYQFLQKQQEQALFIFSILHRFLKQKDLPVWEYNLD